MILFEDFMDFLTVQGIGNPGVSSVQVCFRDTDKHAMDERGHKKENKTGGISGRMRRKYYDYVCFLKIRFISAAIDASTIGVSRWNLHHRNMAGMICHLVV